MQGRRKIQCSELSSIDRLSKVLTANPAQIRIADHDTAVKLLGHKRWFISLKITDLNALATQSVQLLLEIAIARRLAKRLRHASEARALRIIAAFDGRNMPSSKEAILGSGVTLLPVLLHPPAWTLRFRSMVADTIPTRCTPVDLRRASGTLTPSQHTKESTTCFLWRGETCIPRESA